MLFAWERFQAVEPDEHQRLCRPRRSDRRAECRLLQVGAETCSGSVSIPVLAEGREQRLTTQRRKSPNELLCAAVLGLRQQTFRRSSKRICCSAAAAEEVQASGQDALRKPPSQGRLFTYIQPGDDSEADPGLAEELVWASLFATHTHTQIIVAYLLHQKCSQNSASGYPVSLALLRSSLSVSQQQQSPFSSALQFSVLLIR